MASGRVSTRVSHEPETAPVAASVALDSSSIVTTESVVSLFPGILPDMPPVLDDERAEAVLAEYDQRAAEEAEVMHGLAPNELARRRDEFLISIGRETGALVNHIIRHTGARVIVDVGGAFGYSALWLADAARATNGRVVSIERQPAKMEYARERIARAGLASHVELTLGDAREILAALPGPFDFVLLDTWKEQYVQSFDLLYPKLAPGGVVAADNMLHPAAVRSHASTYQRYVRSKPDLRSVLVAVGSGIELTRRQRR